VLDLEDSAQCGFELAMPREAAPQKRRIPVLSPLGSRLLGLRKLDIAHLTTGRTRRDLAAVQVRHIVVEKPIMRPP
jgi:transcription elongation GreA/GreB family factor